ncbi:MAG: glutamate racemase [Saprospiraceae bacterium]|nr:glutamate racemase [Saprospiraceae bacterium]
MAPLHPIGIFDSGYGGLTVFKEIERFLPGYDYIYLGDNARVPYGNRSFETVHEFTWQCVRMLFDMGCPLVILACNTASAKALRTIQQRDLPGYDAQKRVLGVIRPTSEIIGQYTESRHVGIFATRGTVVSESYVIEIEKFFPDIKVHQVACPMWVPLIENNEHLNNGADYFVKKYIDELLSLSPDIDAIILACTHYPLLLDKIRDYLPNHIRVIVQGEIVAGSLQDYLQRHPEMNARLTDTGTRKFYTTDDPVDFDAKAGLFLGHSIVSGHADLG